MGATCRKAFGLAESADDMRANAQRYNLLSEANGALMRVAPLALWACQSDVVVVMDYARQDAQLSHCSPVCQDVNAVFCAVLAHLVKNPGDREGALRLVDSVKPTLTRTVRSWIDVLDEDIDCSRNVGHVRHAFILALRLLRSAQDYESAIAATLLQGGDTDTNAAIVGAMMGALFGLGAIPAYMRGPVERFDCTSWNVSRNLIGHRRPRTYCVRDVLQALASDLGVVWESSH